MTAHWGVPDPAAVEGDDQHKAQAFLDTAVTLKRRIELMLALPIDTLSNMALQREVDDIGKTGAETMNSSATPGTRSDERLRALPHGLGRAVHRGRHRARAVAAGSVPGDRSHGVRAGQPAGRPAASGS